MGAGWPVPIRSASVRVLFEGWGGTPVLEGSIGAGSRNREPTGGAWQEGEGALFAAPRPLAPGETFTAQVIVPKWVFRTPSYNRERQWFRLDWSGWVDAGWLWLAIVLVYVGMWARVGRDRGERAHVVRYEPPDGYSPADVGYLYARRYRTRHFVAALLSLVAQQAVRISRRSGRWTVERTGSGDAARPDERALLEALFPDGAGSPVRLAATGTVARAARSLAWAVAARFEREYFLSNLRWFLGGFGVSLLGSVWLAWRWRFPVPIGGWFLGIVTALWTGLAASLLLRVVGVSRHVHVAGGVALNALLIGLGVTLPVTLVELGLVTGLAEAVPTHMVVGAAMVGLTNVLFYHLLQRPTLRGRGVLDHVEGFRTFLSAVESDRFDRMRADGTAQATFERHLPYAVALGVAGRWAKGLRAGAEGRGGPPPASGAGSDGGAGASPLPGWAKALREALGGSAVEEDDRG